MSEEAIPMEERCLRLKAKTKNVLKLIFALTCFVQIMVGSSTAKKTQLKDCPEDS